VAQRSRTIRIALVAAGHHVLALVRDRAASAVLEDADAAAAGCSTQAHRARSVGHTPGESARSSPAKVRGAKSLVEHCVEHCVELNDGVGHARSLADDAPSEISRRMHDGAKRHPLPWNVPASSAGGIREPSPRSRFAIALSFGRFRTASSPPQLLRLKKRPLDPQSLRTRSR